MLHSFVNYQGFVVGFPVDLDTPPVLSPLKGRWLPDVVPAHDSQLYVVHRVEPVPEDATAIEYTVDPISIEAVKVLAREKVNVQRMQEVGAGFVYNGKLMDSDHTSALNIIGASVAAQIAVARGLSFNITWTCADNSTMNLDAEGIMGMMLEFAKYVDAQYVEARARKAAIDGANENLDPPDVMALAS